MITQADLQELFTYCPDTGKMTYNIDCKGGKKGEVAGVPHNAGYVWVSIRGNRYLMHRLIWMYVHGENPLHIRHVNHIRNDNRIDNIREGARAKNNDLGCKSFIRRMK